MKKRKIRYQAVAVLVIACGLLIGGIWWFFFHESKQDTIQFISEQAVIEYGAEFDTNALIKEVDGTIKVLPTVDTSTIGTQTLKFIVTKDGEDHVIDYTVEVKDTQPPVITLKQNEMVLQKGQSFSIDRYLASVVDPVDGPMSQGTEAEQKGTYWTEGTVKETELGTYTIKIIAMDQNGNKTEKALEITVSDQATSGTDEVTPTYIDGILLVNKNHPLPPDFGELDPTAANALEQLQTAAQAAGYDIPTMSGFRSYDYQVQLYNSYVESDGQEAADTYSARPGYSEHQTGLVFDVGQMEYEYGETPAGTWLREHCHEYGFILRYPEGKENITGYTYEPWHIRYVGNKAAKEIYERDITLEEYLNAY